jgi:transketolase
MSPMLYSVLALTGAYNLKELEQFRQWDSPTPGHPEHDVKRGVENTSGPLGMGHAMALGSSVAERFMAARFGDWMEHKTYVYISDGGIQEEISAAVGRLAGHLGMSSYIMFFDSNDIQLSHMTDKVTSEDTAAKYQAWGWRVETIDGNDASQIRASLERANAEKNRPTLIIGKTVMGKGAVTAEGKSFERQYSTHGQPLSKAGASFEKTVENLGGDAKNPFVIFPDVAEAWKKSLDSKRAAAAARKKLQAEWEKANPEKAERLCNYLNGKIAQIDFASIQQKSGAATRQASGAVLAELAKKIDNMIVMSADLSNSDNTDAFLKNTKELQKGDFSGKFLQIGVAELTMAAIANGIALHGGIQVACGTFFVFSDYMKPAVRLAALMALPVKYVWTHDAFRVGEDGPTHQPIEQEAQIRLLEKMKNLEGMRSLLALRPADAAEGTVAWKMALENKNGPTALILSRQGIADIPTRAGSTRYADALGAEKGAYIAVDCEGKPDVILAANGSEVATLIAAGAILSATKKLKVRIVSAISEALFREQSETYQESVIPFGIPVFGLSAGLPDSLTGIAGPLGKVMGMKRFGASAPFTVLDKQFGYTPENVVAQVETYLVEYKQMVKRIAGMAV